MINHKDVLTSAVNTLRDRGARYGNEDMMFDKASRIASILCDRIVTPWEIAQIMIAVKQVRMSVDPKQEDNYVDLVNYVAFGAQFAGIERSTAEEEEIAAMARRFGANARNAAQNVTPTPEQPPQD